MYNPNDLYRHSKHILKGFAFLALLLPSMQVLADSAATSDFETNHANKVNEQIISGRSAEAFKSVKWKKHSYRNSSTSRPKSSPRVTMDDYERLMRPVSQPKPMQMIWLGQKNRANRPNLPKTTWLGGKGPSD